MPEKMNSHRKQKPTTTKDGVTKHPVGTTFPSHPVAELFPLMLLPKLKELGESMKENGQQEPVILEPDTNRVIDGRNRVAAAALVKIEIRTVYYSGEDVVAFVLAKNLHRRMLSTAQKAIAAAKLANWKLGDNQHSGKGGDANLPTLNTITIGEAAKLFGVSQRTVQSAKAVFDSGNEELIRKMETEEIPVSAAAKTLRPKNKDQRMLPFEDCEPTVSKSTTATRLNDEVADDNDRTETQSENSVGTSVEGMLVTDTIAEAETESSAHCEQPLGQISAKEFSERVTAMLETVDLADPELLEEIVGIVASFFRFVKSNHMSIDTLWDKIFTSYYVVKDEN